MSKPGLETQHIIKQVTVLLDGRLNEPHNYSDQSSPFGPGTSLAFELRRNGATVLVNGVERKVNETIADFEGINGTGYGYYTIANNVTYAYHRAFVRYGLPALTTSGPTGEPIEYDTIVEIKQELPAGLGRDTIYTDSGRNRYGFKQMLIPFKFGAKLSLAFEGGAEVFGWRFIPGVLPGVTNSGGEVDRGEFVDAAEYRVVSHE